jgi:hypothetical protein
LALTERSVSGGIGANKGLNPAETLLRLESIATFFRPAIVDQQNHSRRTQMKIKCILSTTVATFSLAPLIYGQCPQICDGNENTALGQSALVNNLTGMNNTAIGFQALQNSNANGNTAAGYQALKSNTSGTFNTAYGQQALSSNTTSSEHTAFGAFALASFIVGDGNTALGYEALSLATSSFNNTAVGWNSLSSTTTGISDVAVGSGALMANTTGSGNTAVGDHALNRNSLGGANTAIGENALGGNMNGSLNTAIGSDALVRNTTGQNNIVIGDSAGSFLTTGNNNIDIGNGGNAGEANTIRIGMSDSQTATFVAGIRGVPISGGMPVGVSSSGQLGVKPSSARYKEAVQPMGKASEAILALKPITFRYKKELDPDCTPEFGLVAEDVEKVDPDLVARDEQGKPYTVRYEAVNAMLLNEFLKEHRKVEKLEATVVQQQKQIQALTVGLEKVSAGVELRKSSPNIVLNNQ